LNRTEKLVAGLLFSSLLPLCSLDAYIEATYEKYNRSDYTWTFGVSALCWKPQAAESYRLYSIPDGGTEENALQLNSDYTYGYVDPSFSWGFNLFVIKEVPECCSSYRLDWTHIGFKESYQNIERTIPEGDPQGLAILDGFLNDNPGESTICYDRLNLRGYKKVNTCTTQVDGFFGVGYVRLAQNRMNCYEFNEDDEVIVATYKECSNLNAGIAELGVRATMELCPRTFYCLGEAGVVTGIGYRGLRLKGDRRAFAPAGGGWFGSSGAKIYDPMAYFDSDRESQTVCFTGIEYKLELGYECHFCNCDWRLYGGYEGVLYHDLSLYFVPRADGRLIRSISNLGFAGPMAGISVSCAF